MAEQLTLNQRVEGSSPSGLTTESHTNDPRMRSEGRSDSGPYDRIGGVDAFRERLRAHTLMQKVKEAVLTVPVVAERDVQAAYEADPALTESPRSEVWATLTDRLAARQLDAEWRDWLAGQRRCAIIVVMDRTTEIPLDESRAC